MITVPLYGTGIIIGTAAIIISYRFNIYSTSYCPSAHAMRGVVGAALNIQINPD